MLENVPFILLVKQNVKWCVWTAESKYGINTEICVPVLFFIIVGAESPQSSKFPLQVKSLKKFHWMGLLKGSLLFGLRCLPLAETTQQGSDSLNYNM